MHKTIWSQWLILGTLGLGVICPAVAGNATPRSQIRVSQLFGWQPLDATHLLIWTGKEEVWRLTLVNGCPALAKARRIVVTTDHRHIRTGRDKVRVENQECAIREIAPPEPKQKKRPTARKGFVATFAPVDAPPVAHRDASQ